MADTTTQFSNLKIEMKFVDGDTRTQTLKNPKASIGQQDIAELNAFIQANNLLVGDKGGATFGKITKVYKSVGTTTRLDIN